MTYDDLNLEDLPLGLKDKVFKLALIGCESGEAALFLAGYHKGEIKTQFDDLVKLISDLNLNLAPDEMFEPVKY